MDPSLVVMLAGGVHCCSFVVIVGATDRYLKTFWPEFIV